jgi:hypothetical protein
VTDNLQKDHDETLVEFVRILGRIAELTGDATDPDNEDIDLVEAIQRLRQSGNSEDADELAELFQRAEELKALHQVKS